MKGFHWVKVCVTSVIKSFTLFSRIEIIELAQLSIPRVTLLSNKKLQFVVFPEYDYFIALLCR